MWRLPRVAKQKCIGVNPLGFTPKKKKVALDNVVNLFSTEEENVNNGLYSEPASLLRSLSCIDYNRGKEAQC